MKRREFVELIPVGVLGIPMMTNHLYSQNKNSSAASPEWNNPEVLHINTEKPHATMTPFPDKASALTFDRERSPRVRLLNGEWKFNWVKQPADRPLDFFETSYDDSTWDTLPVPSCWQVHGYGVPVYVNRGSPHGKHEPIIPPEDNPVGSYRRTFEVPRDWRGSDVFLHFEGVISAHYVWVNGQRVGYSQGSRTPAEYNITQFLQPGKNLLAVEVYRWCSGSYLEVQDFWRLSGIFRDVLLVSRSPGHLRDFELRATPDETLQAGTLGIAAKIAGNNVSEIAVECLDANGKTILERRIPVRSGKAVFNETVQNITTWNTDRPYLYAVTLSLLSGSGEVLEVIPWKFGFRKVELRGDVFCVNNSPIKLKGVNRHEHNKKTGQVVSRDDILRDIKLFKENNINAIRLSHYPNAPLLYELCDAHGILVMDEANVESHAYGSGDKNQVISNRPYFREMHKDRVVRMFERDKNHTSVVIWSIGNEAGAGPNHEPGYLYLKENDDRPVHYENTQKYGSIYSDFVSHMYGSIRVFDKIENPPAGKPYMWCEYSHAMGNSNGSLHTYWDDVIYPLEKHSGAFIWDWMDQGFEQPVPREYAKNIGKGPVKETFYAYGGWFEHNYSHSGNFCMNGIVGADATPHPGLRATRFCYRNLRVFSSDPGSGTFTVKSWFDFSNAAAMVSGHWSIRDNGRVIHTGKLPDLDIAPHQEKQIHLDLPKLEQRASSEMVLLFEFKALAGMNPMVSEGHLLGWDQFVLKEREAAPAIAKTRAPSPAVAERDHLIVVTGPDFELSFNRDQGVIERWTVRGVERLSQGLRPDFWRFVDNDIRRIEKKSLSMEWAGAGPQAKVNKVDVIPGSGDDAIRIVVDYRFPKIGGTGTVSYAIHSDGSIETTVQYDFSNRSKGISNPQRIGMELQIPAQFENWHWYGHGPESTYIDRNYEALGIFKTTVDEAWIDYSRPQENGNRHGSRWGAFLDANNNGILFVGNGNHLSIGARYYSKATLFDSEYSFQMERSKDIFVNIDLLQRGVSDGWNGGVSAEFQLSKKSYAYSFVMIPVTQEPLDEPVRKYFG